MPIKGMFPSIGIKKTGRQGLKPVFRFFYKELRFNKELRFYQGNAL